MCTCAHKRTILYNTLVPNSHVTMIKMRGCLVEEEENFQEKEKEAEIGATQT